MKRFLAHVNGIISVGEVLVDSEHVSADGIAILRKALDPVQDALKDDSIKLGASSAAPSEKAGTQTKKRKAAEQETDKDVMFLESTPPPTSPTSDNDRLPDTIVKSLAPISPSGRGNEWLRCWTNIVKSIPSNATTNKPAVWPGLITKILIHAFGYDGVNNTIALAEHVLNNYDMLTIDDITSADGDAESPLRPLAIRLKQVWASSRGPAIATADAICYYNLMAEDFDRLEQDIDDLETAMGQEWTARDSRLAQTPQARLNFIITRVFAYLHPGTLTQKERDFRLTSLRKERMMARNIALMVKLFGIGIVPLIAKSPWRQA